MSEQKPENLSEAELLVNMHQQCRGILESKPMHPGSAFVPREIPMSWFFTKSGKPLTVGWKLAPPHRLSSDNRFYNASPGNLRRVETKGQETIARLQRGGLNRRELLSGLDGGWRNIELTEYQEAQLKGRDVVSVSDISVYHLTSYLYSGDGRGSPILADEYIFTEAALLYGASMMPEDKGYPPASLGRASDMLGQLVAARGSFGLLPHDVNGQIGKAI